MKTPLFIALLFCLFSYANTQKKSTDDLNINSCISPIDSSNIFIDPGYYIWCGSSIVGEDGKYYLFYARWPHGTRTKDDDSLNYIFDGFKGWQNILKLQSLFQTSQRGLTSTLKQF